MTPLAPCCGLMGSVFCHNFKTFAVKETPPAELPLSDGYQLTSAVLAITDKLTVREYAVRCSRCGSKGE